jgi:hypothetical protein
MREKKLAVYALTPKTGFPSVTCGQSKMLANVILGCNLKYQARLPENCENTMFVTHIFGWNFLNIMICNIIKIYLFTFSVLKVLNPGFHNMLLCVGNGISSDSDPLVMESCFKTK